MSEERIIKARDACTRFCPYGVRHFCAANGLDFKVFVRDGYPESILRATGDAAAIAAMDEAFHGRK